MKKDRFEQYNAYKDSGVGWLNKMPKSWKCIRIKDVIKGIDQGWSPNAENRTVDDGEWGVLKLSAISNGHYIETNHKALSVATDLKLQYVVKKGNFLLTRSNTPELVGDCCLVLVKPTLTLMYSDLVYCLNINSTKILDRYFNYFLISASLRRIKTVSARGLNTSMVKISQKNIRRWSIFYPTLIEQVAIANYLDSQLAKIDRNIELLNKKVKQYVMLKQSLIKETVTRGLDKNVSLKDSGVDWIGNIPIHWEVQPIRKLLKNSVNKNDKNAESDYLSLVAGIGVIPYSEKGNMGNKKPNDLKKCKIVSPGDLVLNSMNFGIGSFGISRYRGVCSSIYIVMKPIDHDSGEFLYRVFQVKPFQLLISSFGKGIMDIRMAIKWADLKNTHIPCPPIREQKDIANYLDEKTAKIDRIVATITTQIEKLKELRKTLINDVVTGKIKVIQEGQAA